MASVTLHEHAVAMKDTVQDSSGDHAVGTADSTVVSVQTYMIISETSA